MCGIAGLHLKTPALYNELGKLLTPMLEALTSRGPESAGVAIYDHELPAGKLRYSLRSDSTGYDWPRFAAATANRTGTPVDVKAIGQVGLLETSADEAAIREAIAAEGGTITVVGIGEALTLIKDVGLPREICDRYSIPSASGYQAVGHTRMATESAITADHSHPFNPIPDLTLVHNGSFSNHATIRRDLMGKGISFVTDNDTEVAARYLGWRLGQGDDLAQALGHIVHNFDGFFTLLVATKTEFAVVRDAFACKPLVVADHDDYVAVASEYQALADLPGILDAQIFEPMPEEVHRWSHLTPLLTAAT